MSVAIQKYSQTVMRVCETDGTPIWLYKFAVKSPTAVSAEIKSDSFTSQERALVEKKIRSIVTEGATEKDSDYMVRTVGVELELAQKASTPEEKEQHLSSARSLLQSYFSR
jgi:hypothetical protein